MKGKHEHWCAECSFMWWGDSKDIQTCPKCGSLFDIVDFEKDTEKPSFTSYGHFYQWFVETDVTPGTEIEIEVDGETFNSPGKVIEYYRGGGK